MKNLSISFGALTLSCLFFPTAFAQWSSAVTGTTNDAAHDYNDTANWTGATINDTFASTPIFGSATTLYFSAIA